MRNPNSLGYLIKQLCDKSKLSQEKIADIVGKSRPMFSRYVNGQSKFPYDNKKLAKLFKKYKIPFPEKEVAKKDANITKQEKSEATFLKMYRKLDDAQRKEKVIELLANLLIEEATEFKNIAKDF